MIEYGKFTRKTFTVNAIQVTSENMREVAKWCGGIVKPLNEMLYDNEWLIDFPSTKGIDGKPRRAQASVGDWISQLTSGGKFRVYSDKDFRLCFLGDEDVDSERYAKVYQKLTRIAKLQDDATRYDSHSGMDLVLNLATRDILDIFS